MLEYSKRVRRRRGERPGLGDSQDVSTTSGPSVGAVVEGVVGSVTGGALGSGASGVLDVGVTPPPVCPGAMTSGTEGVAPFGAVESVGSIIIDDGAAHSAPPAPSVPHPTISNKSGAERTPKVNEQGPAER